MKQNKRAYVKPTVTFHQTGSAEYHRLRVLLDEEMAKNKEKQSAQTIGQVRDTSTC